MSCLLRVSWVALGFLLAWSTGVVSVACADEHGYRDHEFREHEFHERQYLDARYGHGHYYPPRGFVFTTLPPGPRVVFHAGVQFYFAGGVWYRPQGPGGFVVVAPPIGILVPILPSFYTTVYVGSVPYYYSNDVYYVQGPQGYTVVAPPPANVVVLQPPPTTVVVPPPPPAPPPGNIAQGPDQLFIYPRQGQGEQQQATDRYECHRWAVSQTGYDPTLAPGGAPIAQKQAEYQRAMSACLDGRGYTVK
jgi:Family of unknown function (DUF6515)